MRLLLTFFILLCLSVMAFAATDIAGPFGTNEGMFGFSGRFPMAGRVGSGETAQSGKLLLVDGVSFLLQVDGASKICLAGGC
jgi:hypothetical protein